MKYIVLAVLLLTSTLTGGEVANSSRFPEARVAASVESAKKKVSKKPQKRVVTPPLAERDFLHEEHLGNIPVTATRTIPPLVAAPRSSFPEIHVAPVVEPTKVFRRVWPLNADDKLPPWWPSHKQVWSGFVALFLVYFVIKFIQIVLAEEPALLPKVVKPPKYCAWEAPTATTTKSVEPVPVRSVGPISPPPK